MQIHLLLLGAVQLSFLLLHRCEQIFLFFFVTCIYLDEAFIRDIAADIGFKQFFDYLVNLSDTLPTFVERLLSGSID